MITKRITSKNIKDGRKVLLFLKRHTVEFDYPTTIDDKKLMHLLGINYQKVTRKDEYQLYEREYVIEIDKSNHVELSEQEKCLFNNDQLVCFMVLVAESFPELYNLHYYSDDQLNNGKADTFILNTFRSVFDIKYYNFIVMRHYKYPILPIIIRKICNYNMGEIVQKINELWR